MEICDDRECVVHDCDGCDRTVHMLWESTGAPVKVCSTYLKPSEWWRRGGCPFNIKVEAKPKVKVRVGQQKQKGKKKTKGLR